MLILFSFKYAIFKWICRQNLHTKGLRMVTCSCLFRKFCLLMLQLLNFHSSFFCANKQWIGWGWKRFCRFLLAKMEMCWFSASGEINLLKWMNRSALIICSLVLEFKLQLTSASPNSQWPCCSTSKVLLSIFIQATKMGIRRMYHCRGLQTTCFEVDGEGTTIPIHGSWNCVSCNV